MGRRRRVEGRWVQASATGLKTAEAGRSLKSASLRQANLNSVHKPQSCSEWLQNNVGLSVWVFCPSLSIRKSRGEWGDLCDESAVRAQHVWVRAAERQHNAPRRVAQNTQSHLGIRPPERAFSPLHCRCTRRMTRGLESGQSHAPFSGVDPAPFLW